MATATGHHQHGQIVSSVLNSQLITTFTRKLSTSVTCRIVELKLSLQSTSTQCNVARHRIYSWTCWTLDMLNASILDIIAGHAKCQCPRCCVGVDIDEWS